MSSHTKHCHSLSSTINLTLLAAFATSILAPLILAENSFRFSRQQTVTTYKKSNVELSCNISAGDEPVIVEWLRNKRRIRTDNRVHIINKQIPTGVFSLLIIENAQRIDNAVYDCVARNSAGEDTLTTHLLIHEEPDMIQDIQKSQIGSRTATLTWKEPYDGNNRINDYMFRYKQDLSTRASHDDKTDGDDWKLATPVLVPSNLTLSPNIRAAQAAGTPLSSLPSDRQFTIENLEPATRYILQATAINGIGPSIYSAPMSFTTEEERPDFSPLNVSASAINTTALMVSWEEPIRSRVIGRILGYYVGYREILANRTLQHRQSFIEKTFFIDNINAANRLPHNAVNKQTRRFEKIVNELKRNTAYEIIVKAFNSQGAGPPSSITTARTIEMEVPKPVKLVVRHTSNDSIHIEWFKDPTDQSTIDTYELNRERVMSMQDSFKFRLTGNLTHYKAQGLKCGTHYKFYIFAHNKIGRSVQSEVVAASTSGSLPVAPTKSQLIKQINSTCLGVNLNAFQDNGCRIKSFAVRFRFERMHKSPRSDAGAASTASLNEAVSLNSDQDLSATALPIKASLINGHDTNVGSSNDAAVNAQVGAGANIAGQKQTDWLTFPPQHPHDEDKTEYLCNLHPNGEYTIFVAALNDVGRTEIEYSVLMSSEEFMHKTFIREIIDSMFTNTHGVFGYLQSLILFVAGALCLTLMLMMLYSATIRYYHKFTILHNQLRATRRANRDAKRRRKQQAENASAVGDKHQDAWVDDYYGYAGSSRSLNNSHQEDDDDNSSGSGNLTMNGRKRLIYGSTPAAASFRKPINNSDDMEDEDDSDSPTTRSSSSAVSNALARQQLGNATVARFNTIGRSARRAPGRAYPKHVRSASGGIGWQQRQINASNANYIANLSCSAAFDASSILTCDSSCQSKKQQQHYQLTNAELRSKQLADNYKSFAAVGQFTKMNEYSMMPQFGAHLQQPQHLLSDTSTCSQSTPSSAISGRQYVITNNNPPPPRQHNQPGNNNVWYTLL